MFKNRKNVKFSKLIFVIWVVFCVQKKNNCFGAFLWRKMDRIGSVAFWKDWIWSGSDRKPIRSTDPIQLCRPLVEKVCLDSWGLIALCNPCAICLIAFVHIFSNRNIYKYEIKKSWKKSRKSANVINFQTFGYPIFRIHQK